MSRKAPNQVWVSPRDGDWVVHKPGADRAIRETELQSDAINTGRQVAINQRAELIIQGRDGKIRERNSYGNDPYPPRG